ncbi:MAG: regulatory protein RecX [Bacillota bacterium]
MMVITSVERNKRNKEMLSVFVDEKYAFSILEEDYYRLCLYEMKEISYGEIESIKKDVTFRSAKSKAVKYLSFKLLSEMELYGKLQTKGYDDDVITDVIIELKAMGYINDMIYAQKFVYERLKLKPKSKKMLRLELKNKGIPEDIIEEVLDSFDYDEDVAIERLVRKKFGKYDLDDPKIVKKLYSFLLYRGFDLENVKAVLNRIKTLDG